MLKSITAFEPKSFLPGIESVKETVKSATFTESDFYLFLIRSMVDSKKHTKRDLF